MITKLLVLSVVLPLARWNRYVCRSTITGSVSLYLLTIVCVWWRLQSPWSVWDTFFALGFAAAWPTIEAGYHQHVMHNGRHNLSAINHRAHHLRPTVYNGLMPLFPVLLLASAFWVLHARPIASAVLVTALVFLCWYEATHTLIHLGWAPRYWADNHLEHHRDHRINFNVTAPLPKWRSHG